MNVPRVFIVIGSLDVPGESTAVVNVPASCAASCERVSMFFQITRCPTLTVVGLGANEFAPLMPAMLIVTSGPGVDDDGDEGLELPHAAASAAEAMIASESDLVMGRLTASRMPYAT